MFKIKLNFIDLTVCPVTGIFFSICFLLNFLNRIQNFRDTMQLLPDFLRIYNPKSSRNEKLF